MFRTDAPGHVGNLYDAGDPGAGVIPTRVSADHMNAIQEEFEQWPGLAVYLRGLRRR